MPSTRLSLLAVTLGGLVFSSPAFASSLDYFTLTDTTTSTVYTFSLPSNPTPSYYSYGIGISGFANVPFSENGVAQLPGTVGFYDAAEGGGLALEDSGQNVLESTYGKQLFTGSLINPTFILGDFPMFADQGLTEQIGTLVISDTATAPTPEPASIALLGTGVLSLAGFVRRRTAC